MQQLTLTRPDDWHLHLRDGALLKTTVAASAQVFNRAVVMPNLVPPVTTVEMALAYRQRILTALPDGLSFQPLMALYLTAETTVEEIKAAAEDPHVIGFKLYPSGATLPRMMSRCSSNIQQTSSRGGTNQQPLSPKTRL